MLVSCISTDVVRTTPDRKGDYRPLVFLFTDGQPTDDWRGAVARVKAFRSPGIANIYAIGCGEDVDYSVLREITPTVFKTTDMDAETIRKAFVWITASVGAASASIGTGMGELPRLPAECSGALKEVMSWECVPTGEPRQVFIHARCNIYKEAYLMRYVLEDRGGCYVAASAHKLQGDDASGGTKLPPVQSDRLVGVPSCPYCENAGAAMCGCTGVMCINPHATFGVICPHCGTEQRGRFEKGNFSVRQSAG